MIKPIRRGITWNGVKVLFDKHPSSGHLLRSEHDGRKTRLPVLTTVLSFSLVVCRSLSREKLIFGI
jgi:hypothetical protein